ncbi:MAG: CHAT domain-containing protein, partial [Bacteroidota bacterium]
MIRIFIYCSLSLISLGVFAQSPLSSDSIRAGRLLEKAYEQEKQRYLDSAINNFSEASQIYKAINDTLKYVQCQYHIGRMEILARRFKRGSELFERIIQEYSVTLDDHPAWKVEFYNNFGDCYGGLDNFEKALECYHLSANTYKSNSLEYPQLKNKYLSGLSNTYRYSYKYQEAAYYANEWIRFNENNPVELAHAYNSLGLAYSRQFNHQKSIDAFKKCLEIREIHYPDRVPFVINNIGLQYHRINDFDSANHWYSKGLKKCDELFDKKILIHSVLRANMAFNYGEQGRYDSAIANLRRSIRIRNKWRQDRPLIQSQLYLMTYMSQLGLTSEADSVMNEVNKLLQDGERSPGLMTLAFNEYGYYYRKIGEPEKALDYYNKALMTNLKDSVNASRHSANNLSKLYVNDYRALISISGQIISLAQINQKVDDNETYKTMIDYFEGIKTLLARFGNSQTEPFGYARIVKGRSELRQAVIESAGILYKKTQNPLYISFIANLMESARMHLLKEQLRYEEMVKFSDLPDSLMRKRQQLLAESYYHQQKGSTPEQLYEIDNELYIINSLLKENAREYHEFMVKSNSVSIDRLKESLDDHQSIIQYYFIGNKLYVLTHTNKKDDFRIIDWSVDDDQTIQSLQTSLKDNDLEGIDRHSLTLAKTLDLRSTIPEDIKEIIIIPDDKLSSIPFEILPYKTHRHLLANFSIRYASGISEFDRSTNQAKKDIAILAFAPFSGTSTSNKLVSLSAADELERSALSELPASRREVTAISKLLSGTPLLGSDASETNFKNLAPRAEIIHLATHSLVSDKNPLYNRILFSLGNSEKEDGNLHTYELFNLDLNADLVTLSACNTGMGKYYTGEGVLGLATGFKFAGVPNLLISLWSVPDVTTAKIMERFYFHLYEGQSKANALRQAKLDYLASADGNTSSPYYWAGFILNSEISSEKPKNDWTQL